MLDLIINGSVCEGCNKCWALSAMGVFVREGGGDDSL